MTEENKPTIDDVTLDDDLSRLNASKETAPGQTSDTKSDNPKEPASEFIPGISSANDAQNGINEYKQLLGPICRQTTNAFCPDFNISDDQCELLAEAYAPLLQKYFPNSMQSPEMGAVVVTLAVFGPPLMDKYLR